MKRPCPSAARVWLALLLCAMATVAGAAPRVLCTTYPVWLLTRDVAAGVTNATVELLLPPDLGCPHDYMLTPRDLQRILAADVVVINGLGMESFLDRPLRQNRPAAPLVDATAGIPDPIPLDADEHEHQHGREPEDAGTAFNPHLFASPRLAALMAANIAAGLATADPSGAERYRANAAAAGARLRAMGEELAAFGRTALRRRIVTQHNALAYLARDAGLQVEAVVQEHPGEDPSAADMIALVRRIRSAGVAVVFTEPQNPSDAAAVIAREAGIATAVIDPLATGPAEPPAAYYETVMRRNLETLRRVLSKP